MRLSLCILVGFAAFLTGNAQSVRHTRVLRVEIDGKQVKKPYKVFIRGENEGWLEAKRTPSGFATPADLAEDESGSRHISLLFLIGRHRLEFSDVAAVALKMDWVVGIDTKPFSRELVLPEEEKAAKHVYYVILDGVGYRSVRIVVVKT